MQLPGQKVQAESEHVSRHETFEYAFSHGGFQNSEACLCGFSIVALRVGEERSAIMTNGTE